MDGAHFVLVALQGPLHLQRHQIPNSHRLLAGGQEKPADWVDHHVFDAASQLRPRQVRNQLLVLKIPNPDVLGGRGDEQALVDRHGEDGAVVGVDLADAFPAVAGLPLGRPFLSLFAGVGAVVVEIGGGFDLFEFVDGVEHGVEFFEGDLVPAVWFCETRQLLRADVLVLAHQVLYALVLLLHHLALPPALLQLGRQLPVRPAQILHAPLQLAPLLLLQSLGAGGGGQFLLFEPVEHQFFARLRQISAVLCVEGDDLLALADYLLPAGLVLHLHLVVPVHQEVVLEEQVFEREKEGLHQHAQSSNRVVLRVVDYLGLHVEGLEGRSHDVGVMGLAVLEAVSA